MRILTDLLDVLRYPGGNADRLLVPLPTLRLGTPTHLVVPEGRAHAFFDTPDGVIASVTLQGRYPEYMGVVRDSHTTHCTVRKAALLGALKQLQPALTEKVPIVQLGIGSPLLLTPAHLRGADRWSLDVEAVMDGQDGHACFDARYLTDALKHLPAECIGLNYSGPRQSIELVSDTSDAWAVLMPITDSQP